MDFSILIIIFFAGSLVGYCGATRDFLKLEKEKKKHQESDGNKDQNPAGRIRE